MTLDAQRFAVVPELFLRPMGVISFWMAAVLLLLNFEGFKAPGMAWIENGVLFLSAVVTVGGSKIRWPGSLSPTCRLLVLAFVLNICIGSAVRFLRGLDNSAQVISLYTQGIPQNIIIFTVALCGGRLQLNRTEGGGAMLYRGIVMILILGCILTLLSPVLIALDLVIVEENVAYDIAQGPVQSRFTGVYGTPNRAAMIACFTAACASAILIYPKCLALAYVGLSVGLCAVIVTGSKTGIICITVIFLFFLLFGGPMFWKRFIAWILVGCIVFGFTILIIEPERLVSIFRLSHLGRIEQILRLAGGDVSSNVAVSGRLLLWKLGLEEFFESPLYGAGSGAVETLSRSLYSPSIGFLQGPHSSYLQHAAESGVIPIILFLIGFASLFQIQWIVPQSPGRNFVVGTVIVICLFAVSEQHMILRPISVLFLGIIVEIAKKEVENQRSAVRES